MPRVVVIDDSNLYPAVSAELWPETEHQLCVFHIIKNINKLILDTMRRLRTPISRRGKADRQKKRGRKSKKVTAKCRGLTVKADVPHICP
jgi:transposase-like protein